MPNAIITDTVLPANSSRKVNFFTALNTALNNAGMGNSWFDEYELQDGFLRNATSNTTYYEIGANGAAVIKVKEQNNILLPCGVTTSFHHLSLSRLTQPTGTLSAGAGTDRYYSVGNAIIHGGWDSINNRIPATNDMKSCCIGGYGIPGIGDVNIDANVAQGNYFSQSSNRRGSYLNEIGIPSTTTVTQQTPTEYSMSVPIFMFPDIGSYSTSSSLNVGQRSLMGMSPFISGNPPGTGTIGFDSLLNINFKAINHPEIRGVFIYHAAGSSSLASAFIGYISPSIKPSWWDATAAPYLFLSTDNNLLVLNSFAYSKNPNPNNRRAADSIYWVTTPTMISRNPVTNRRSFFTNITIQNESFIAGKFSSDIAIGVVEAGNRFDTITLAGNTYLMLSNAPRTLAIKIA